MYIKVYTYIYIKVIFIYVKYLMIVEVLVVLSNRHSKGEFLPLLKTNV